jgi:DNA-binding Lrp family transcriptional regulator
MQLTKFDKQLLNLIQTGLPLTAAPFAEIGLKLGCDEMTILERIAALKEQGIIRRFGAFFDAGSLGYKGHLVAVRVEPESLAAVAAAINSWPQVTHNDERDHWYNLWFTIQSRDSSEVDQLITAVTEMSGVETVISLPTTDRYKVNVEFQVE